MREIFRLELKCVASMATPHVAGVAALWAQRQLETTGRVNNQILMSQLIASGTFASLLAKQKVQVQVQELFRLLFPNLWSH